MPAGLTGGLLIVFLTGGVISLGSLVGFLTVLGLAARSGVLLIARYRRLQREEGEALGELILRGGREQLVPTLTTAVATGLAVLPFVVLGDRAGLELVYPMALVVMGGLVTSTLLTLVILPTLYLRLEDARSRSRRPPSSSNSRVSVRPDPIRTLLPGRGTDEVQDLENSDHRPPGTRAAHGGLRPAPAEEVPPETAVTVVPIEGTDLGAVILTARSAERLGIHGWSGGPRARRVRERRCGRSAGG